MGDVPRLHATTRSFEATDTLLEFAARSEPLWWSRRDSQLVGIGEAARITVSGPDRIAQASRWWNSVVETASVDNRVGGAGTGLVAFATFTFADASPTSSVLIVPQVVLGTRDGATWITEIGLGARASESRADAEAFPARSASPLTAPIIAPPRIDIAPLQPITLAESDRSQQHYVEGVETIVGEIARGSVEKVVLSRSREARIGNGVDQRRIIRSLAENNPAAWVFAIDGFLGASPETLVRVRDGQFITRVLAGTERRGATRAEDDTIISRELFSQKNRDEHRFAVQTAWDALAGMTGLLDSAEPGGSVTASPEPFALEQPVLWHLATDIRASLARGTGVLDLVLAMHPTAAVAGVPKHASIDLIEALEGEDRGRYAGPVGWLDAAGNGEFAVGLRSAQLTPTPEGGRIITARAGGGVVQGSDPQHELAESTLKFRVIGDALERVR